MLSWSCCCYYCGTFLMVTLSLDCYSCSYKTAPTYPPRTTQSKIKCFAISCRRWSLVNSGAATISLFFFAFVFVRAQLHNKFVNATSTIRMRTITKLPTGTAMTVARAWISPLVTWYSVAILYKKSR